MATVNESRKNNKKRERKKQQTRFTLSFSYLFQGVQTPAYWNGDSLVALTFHRPKQGPLECFRASGRDGKTKIGHEENFEMGCKTQWTCPRGGDVVQKENVSGGWVIYKQGHLRLEVESGLPGHS